MFDCPIAVMDADCALSSLDACMIHRRDRSGEIWIAPIQSARGAALMRENGLDLADPDTRPLTEGGRVWRDLDALIRVGECSGGMGRVVSLLRVLPRPVRDWLSARVARNRYRFFGRGDMCALPDPAFHARLLS